MTPTDVARIEQFVTRWQTSSGSERANYQMFFTELCDALGVERPNVNGSAAMVPYCFDKHITIYHPSGKKTPGYIDFYKADHFLIEAKQGSNQAGKGTAKRGTNAYLKAMEAAFVQAIAYTRNLPNKPPFLLTCDIGDHFELWTGFNGDYGGYGARQDIALTDLRKEAIFALFVDIFTDPQKRNPEKIAAKVTRAVAADLAELSKRLEGLHQPQEVAHFLMRCIFTMFAEDVGLLKEHLFTEALETRWLPNPKTFKPEVEALWQAMNDGTAFGFYGRLLKFNGGLFAEATAFELNAEQLAVLLTAAKREWKDVEPAIFGTLLERALDTRERSKLGAHYTPRSYVERLVRPVVMEPLREQWDLVQGEVKQLLVTVETEPTAAQKKKAVAALEGFLTELRKVKILDPACGSGNFLYVTLDLIKQLESEVLRRLEDVTGQAQLRLDIDQVNPSQFLGIELNPRAAAIADLVIWIGYLQWHFRRFGDIPPVEPVLREYKNIKQGDAVLAYDNRVEDVDPKTGKVRTRWGGRTMKHPVTGELVPDPSEQIPIYRYINPRPAEWQEADYIVSNPPFLGKLYMLERLGEGYVKALRDAYKGQVPDSCDYVMYWWHRAAQLTAYLKTNGFGFVTTNSITQTFNRRLVSQVLEAKKPIHLIFAIPDHPWVDDEDCAAVRIAMTAGKAGKGTGRINLVAAEKLNQDDGIAIVDLVEIPGVVQADISVGPNVAGTKSLKSNESLTSMGVMLGNRGFLVEKESSLIESGSLLRPTLNGNDIMKLPRNVKVIDFFGLTEEDARQIAPAAFQQVLLKVKPERDLSREPRLREYWWLFARFRPHLREMTKGLMRYIVTPETAKYRVFMMVSAEVLPEHRLVVFGSDDAYNLGVLSSSIHVTWALATGGTLEDRPVYNKTVCFDRFPFPDPTPALKQKIRDLGERLDAHRKRVQAQHPDVTITAMYNLLEKIRAGVELTDSDRAFNNKALVSTLKQIHDELDAAVFEAYGWENLKAEGERQKAEVDEMILERLVALNAERSEEERNGLIRWLRPDYQAPGEVQTQQIIEGMAEVEVEAAIAPVEQQPFPKVFKDQLAAVRDLLRTQGGEWTVVQIAAQFKGASRQKQTILTCLESLEALGIIARHGEEGSDRWYLAELQKAS
jgi:hypothetical protein